MKTSFLMNVLLLLLLIFCVAIMGHKSFMKLRSPDKEKFKEIDYNVISVAAIRLETLKINFQDSDSATPPGWIKDYGQAFGNKPGVFELSNLEYGWKKRADGEPINITENSRSRDAPDDVLLEGLIHMQANSIGWWNGKFKGTKVESYWELRVLNGTYDVVITVGDGAVGKAQEKSCINVEGTNVVKDFVPYGKVGSFGRFKTVKKIITVKDGYLTINADGGINTKINNIQVTPLKLFPYINLTPINTNLLVSKDDSARKIFKLPLNIKGYHGATYQLNIKYGSNASGWFHLIADNGKAADELAFDYSVAAQLPVGYYKVKLTISSPGCNAKDLIVTTRVVNNSKPYVISVSPETGSDNVNINTTSIAANNLSVPLVKGYNGGINNKTITLNSVKLLAENGGVYRPVKGVVQGTGGGDAVSFSPSYPLMPNTHYRFMITSAVKSYSGNTIAPFQSDFYTGTRAIDSSKIYDITFSKQPVAGTQNKNYTSLCIGPDDRFYALRIDGVIERYNIDHASGLLSGEKVIDILKRKYHERTAVGLVFDPSSTPQNIIAWVSHSSGGLTSAPPFDGNISRLSGDDLSNEQLIITKLPRSTRDHMVNGMAFGPDKALYICLGSNSSAGAFDKSWQREETLLAGSVLRLDMNKLREISLPLNVETSDNQQLINTAPADRIKTADGKYNPYGRNSPLTIYASGIRNAYDLIWHSNGQLYVPANGSGGGGNSPASMAGNRRPDGSFYNADVIPATSGVQVQHDWLFRVNPNLGVGYFGHPNPLRGEYVVNRGYPDNPLYNKAVKPDANYRGAAFDFGLNHSPNGVIEYKSNAFGGVLKGKLLICRFSGGGDIIVLEPGSLRPVLLKNEKKDAIYDIVNSARGSDNLGLKGMSAFANPLDIVEDTKTGNLYVSEFNWNNNPNLVSQITLLKVAESQPKPVYNAAALSRHPVAHRSKL